MRDNRFDGEPVTTDITDLVRSHTGDGLVRSVRPRKPRDKARDRANAKRAKASRKANRR